MPDDRFRDSGASMNASAVARDLTFANTWLNTTLSESSIQQIRALLASAYMHGYGFGKASRPQPVMVETPADLLKVAEDVREAMLGLLELAAWNMPDILWYKDSRVQTARKLLGQSAPARDELRRRFQRRAALTQTS